MSIDHPKGWEVESKDNGIIFRNPNNTLEFPNFRATEFTVTVNDLANDTSLDKYVRQSLSEDREHDLALLSTNETMISGNNSAREVLYNLGKNETLAKVTTYFTTDNGIGYRISFYVIPEIDFQNYMPIIQKMIDSFKIL